MAFRIKTRSVKTELLVTICQNGWCCRLVILGCPEICECRKLETNSLLISACAFFSNRWSETGEGAPLINEPIHCSSPKFFFFKKPRSLPRQACRMVIPGKGCGCGLVSFSGPDGQPEWTVECVLADEAEKHEAAEGLPVLHRLCRPSTACAGHTKQSRKGAAEL